MAKKKKKTNNNNKGGSPSAGKQPAVGSNSNDINDDEVEKIQITIHNSECTNSDWSSVRKCEPSVVDCLDLLNNPIFII